MIFVIRNGRLVDQRRAAPLNPMFGRLHIISDTMDPLRHMASGRMFDSKSEFRKETRAHGCVEIGTEKIGAKPRKPWRPDKKKRVDDIKRAIHTLQNR